MARRFTLEAAFGIVVREARLGSGLSQEALAGAAGLHRTYVSQIERGLKSPSLGAMHALAEALDTPLHVLIAKADAAAAPPARKRVD